MLSSGRAESLTQDKGIIQTRNVALKRRMHEGATFATVFTMLLTGLNCDIYQNIYQNIYPQHPLSNKMRLMQKKLK